MAPIYARGFSGSSPTYVIAEEDAYITRRVSSSLSTTIQVVSAGDRITEKDARELGISYRSEDGVSGS